MGKLLSLQDILHQALVGKKIVVRKYEDEESRGLDPFVLSVDEQEIIDFADTIPYIQWEGIVSLVCSSGFDPEVCIHFEPESVNLSGTWSKKKSCIPELVGVDWDTLIKIVEEAPERPAKLPKDPR